ncbi:MAG TPA: VWA domain-containing protein [Dehalococcoidia bacterium]|nr:VWA domain-containing protein [Dehalococcoidia bacterium]
MFIDFFYTLKQRKVPVSITEWMTLMEALNKGYISNLDDFYYLARAILVKSEAYFDQYDLAFQEYFQGLEVPPDIPEKILDWLKDPINRMTLSEKERALFNMMDFDELLREFEKRLAEQTEQHDGGSHWIGRGGTGPFGHSGSHPAGIRVGGESRGRGAIQIAQERRFRNYRSDLTLDVRQIKMALRRIRQLSRIGPEDELDLGKTIDATAKNAGDIDMRWTRSRKNAVKLLLLMDVGGSMNPYAMLCSQLFSAAHSSTHFKNLQYFYFHNCIYENLYQDMERQEEVSTEHILRTLEPDYKVILVGDARMAIQELTEKDGAIYYYQRNETPGIVWLKQIAEHFTHRVWLNPEEPSYWNHPTVMLIGRLFPMFELTLDGLGEAVRKLMVKR